MGDMFRLSVSHHQVLFLFIKIQILDKDMYFYKEKKDLMMTNR